MLPDESSDDEYYEEAEENQMTCTYNHTVFPKMRYKVLKRQKKLVLKI